MGPHVGAQGGGQGVEGQRLRQVPPLGVPGDGEQVLVGVHSLHHRAALAALDGAGTGEALVPGEVAAGHAVVPLQQGVGLLGHGVGVLPGDAGVQRSGLQGHGQVHHMGDLGPLALWPGKPPPAVELLVVEALHPQGVGQVHQPLLRAPLVQPENGDEALEPAGGRPVEQGVVLHVDVEVLQRPVDGLLDALVLGAVVIDHQHLADQEQGPHVIAVPLLLGAGAQPTILLLLGQDGVDIPLGPGLHVLVLQQPCQGDEAVQPIGDPLPSLLFPADPSAVPDIGPDLVQVAAQARRLDLQLLFQPSGGPQLPGGKGGVRQ